MEMFNAFGVVPIIAVILNIGFSVIKYGIIIFIGYRLYKKMEAMEEDRKEMKNYLKNINDYIVETKEDD